MFTERALETAALQEKVLKLKEMLSYYQKEAALLDCQMDELKATNEKLSQEKSQTLSHINNLCSLIDQITTVTSSC